MNIIGCDFHPSWQIISSPFNLLRIISFPGGFG
jgi:hypothetical protein